MKKIRIFLVSCLTTIFLSSLISSTSTAHHSFAMFDDQSEMWLEGTISLFQWTNPHTFIHVLVEASGVENNITELDTPVEWSLEGGSPNILSRNGWKRTSLEEGERVRVLIYPLKDGNAGGTFLEIHKEDGTILYYHG
jgi:hypothetical protein